ncbi:MAG TPA: right-handed parallel beta-helix repeat-containing protein [Gaiellaceae bacterium]|jgi:nitrous oxidase accessory protein NosD
MSYTLKGRLESRVGTALLPVLAALVLAAGLREWWPVQLAALMLAVGLALDVLGYHRLLDYQPGWLAVPLGLLELVLVMALARWWSVDAPLAAALAFYAVAWLVAQVLTHAAFPLARMSYAEDGGELGRLGFAVAAVALGALAAAGGVAWAQLPPTVHLSAGVHQGPLVIDRREHLVGERGAVVRGGIVVRADDVTIRNVSVLGGENGIEVERATGVVLDNVAIAGAALDGIHVRFSQVTIRNCSIDSPAGFTQGIDISYSIDLGMSMVEGCTITGGREGIVTHSAPVGVVDNRVSGTALRGIAMTEMSMGEIESNHVAGALGVGIFCGDRSECTVARNRVAGTRPDRSSGDLSRRGYGIEADFQATAELEDNELLGNARGVGSFADADVVDVSR